MSSKLVLEAEKMAELEDLSDFDKSQTVMDGRLGQSICKPVCRSGPKKLEPATSAERFMENNLIAI